MTRTIPQIDRDIDANRKRRDQTGDQRIARESELFRERGFAQLERDQREHDRIMGAARKARAPRPKKCPACGNHTLFAA